MISSLLGKLVEQKRENVTVWALLAVNFCIRCIVAARPLEYLDGLTIPDDAYLSLTIARNIAKGLGPLYGFEYTNGFQPLYVFLMVPTFMLVPDDLFIPVRVALYLLILFDTLTLYLLYRYTAALSKSSITPILVSLAWVCNPYFINTSLNGLETSLSAFFIVAALYYFRTISNSHAGSPTLTQCFFLGILVGFAIFARIDNVFLALSIVVVLWWQHWHERFWILSERFLLIALGIGLVMLPWLLYSYHYTGDVYPVSGKAVRFLSLGDVQHKPTLENWYFPILGYAAMVLAKKNWVPFGLMGLMTVLLWARGGAIRSRIKETIRRLAPALLFSVLLICAYVFFIFTPWFFLRYFYPVAVLMLLSLAVWMDLFFEGLKTKKHMVAFAGIFFTLIVTLNLTHKHFRELLFSTDTKTLGYMNLGLWATTHFPDGTVIGAPQSGALGYFANNLRVVNLDGVVNKSCFEALVQYRGMEYVRKAGIQYIVGWEINLDHITEHSANFKQEELILITKIEEFTSRRWEWYVMKVNYNLRENTAP